MKSLLKKYFGYDSFRPLQEEIINHIVGGNDCFVLMPTGGGKSLCYQLPALKFKGLTLVISPLIALMKDQVDALRTCGVNAEFINSSLTPNQINEICLRAQKNEIKILYIAPERFALQNFQEFLKKLPINLIAVDEAHCISEWGHDFRPDYRHLSQLKNIFPSVPLVALTATATQKVRADIVNQLQLKNASVFVSSFNRENLHIRVFEKKQTFEKLVNLLRNYKNEPVIIYCFSRKETEEIAQKLRTKKFRAQAYHAGLNSKERSSVQELFIKDEINIIVATIAFGMGIDKPDVRLVVHYTYPKTLEGYYQEIGRAGRDGLPSECVMFYTYGDTRKHEFFLEKINDPKLRQLAYEKLRQVLNYAQLSTCRKKYLLNYFGEQLKETNCHSCDICNPNTIAAHILAPKIKLPKIKITFDAAIAAKKILSAVIRTKNSFEKNYIINVLLGKNKPEILRNNHDQLSVFGIVADLSSHQLNQIIHELINAGYLIEKQGKYPALLLTKSGAAFLQSNNKFKLPSIEPKEIAPKTKHAQPPKEKIGYNKELFEELRCLRKEIANLAGMPPFVVFGNISLQEMARYLPRNNEEFLRINGVGNAKLKKFGKQFLKAINRFAQEYNITPIKIPDKK